MKVFYLPFVAFLLFSSSLFAQVDIDKSINLSSPTPADAKISGIKQVSAARDAVSAEVLQKGSLIYAAAGGTGSAYTLTLAPAITVYTDGMEVRFKAPANNAAAVTLNVNGVGAKLIKKNVSTNLAAGDITTGQLVSVIYDAAADAFQLASRIEQLSNTATPGTYNNVTVNSQGLVTGGSNVAYLTGNQNITLSGDVTGNGATAITTNVARINGATLGTTTATAGNLLIGSGSQWVSTPISGDATLSAAGALTISQNSNNYIRNQTSADQAAGFRVNGNGIFNGGRIGVGTLSPNARLTVGGSFVGSAASANFTVNGGTLGTTAGNTLNLGSIGFLAGTNEVSYGFEALRTSNGTDWTTSAIGIKYNVDATAPVNNAQIWLTSGGNVGIGTSAPARKLEVNGDVYARGKFFLKTSDGQGSGAHGISWYDPGYVTWYDYMSPNGGSNAPNGTGAPTDATAGVTSWARRFNIENVGTYGWLFESGPNNGTAPTVKFGINANNGTFHSTGSGFVDGNLQVNGSAYWGSSLTRTETRDNAGLRGDAGARSGFFETSNPTPASNWYPGASSWQHLIDVRHSNNGNNYAMQFAGSFFDQRLYFRKTSDNAAAAWSEVMTTSSRRAETYHTFSQPNFQSGTYIAWFPAAGGEGSDDAGGGGVALPQNRNCTWVAPAAGRLLRVVLRTDNSSSNGGTEIRGRVSIGINGALTTYAGVNINLDQDQSIVIDIPTTEGGFSFNAGDLINVGINVSDQGGCPGGDCWIEDNDYFASCVWQYTN